MRCALNKTQVHERLAQREAQIEASPWGADKSIQKAIQRTLDALDHPFSYYVVLSDEERAAVRVRWAALASARGMKLPKARARRAPPELPAAVSEFFGDAACLPHRPRASDNFREVGVHAVSWGQAQGMRSIELNQPAQWYWLIFDCDHTDPDRWKSAGLPEPSFITINPSSRKHHVVYKLRSPVCRSERARYKPVAYMEAIREGLRQALSGDVGYTGMMTKNPLHPDWLTVRPAEMPAYSLAELAAAVDLRSVSRKSSRRGAKQPSVALQQVGIGSRNVALFDAVRCWARTDNLDDLRDYADRCNATFGTPLGVNEVESIVTSVTKYIRKGRRSNRSLTEFSAKQAARGALGGRPRTTKDSKPWHAAGVGRTTWYEAQGDTVRPGGGRRVGRPPTTKESQPWVAEGIARSTWYRHRKAGHQLPD